MKNILLLHPALLSYKVRIYNRLYGELLDRGYKLHMWASHIQEESEDILFPVINKAMTIKNYMSVVRKYNIFTQINILAKEPHILFFYCFSIFYGKFAKISSIYYGHGLDLSKRNNRLKITVQNVFHVLFDKILLYSNDQCKYLWKIHFKKVFIANNTMLLDGYRDREEGLKQRIKKRYGISEKYVVLFLGRISRRKNLPVLLEMFGRYFARSKKIAFVVVGPGMAQKHLEQAGRAGNFHYFGPVYDVSKINEIFYISDIFCVPGSLGLGIVEAMYWGLPVLTMDVFHGPEAMYIRNGYNGFIVKNMHEMAKTILCLLLNERLLSSVKTNARSTILNEAGIDRMFKGFYEVLSSVS